MLPSTCLCIASIDLQQISFLLEARHTAVSRAGVPLTCDDMSRPMQLGFSEHSIDARKLSASQNLRDRDHVTPADVKELAQACHVKSIQFPCMSLVDGPLFASIRAGWKARWLCRLLAWVL